jgi:hypothetical protein
VYGHHHHHQITQRGPKNGCWIEQNGTRFRGNGPLNPVLLTRYVGFFLYLNYTNVYLDLLDYLYGHHHHPTTTHGISSISINNNNVNNDNDNGKPPPRIFIIIIIIINLTFLL